MFNRENLLKLKAALEKRQNVASELQQLAALALDDEDNKSSSSGLGSSSAPKILELKLNAAVEYFESIKDDKDEELAAIIAELNGILELHNTSDVLDTASMVRVFFERASKFKEKRTGNPLEIGSEKTQGILAEFVEKMATSKHSSIKEALEDNKDILKKEKSSSPKI